MSRPELLAPAGSPEALIAAVQNGADAVYLGWGEFNARRNAKNFSDEEFELALRTCHTLGVRVFLTLNTLLTDRELPLALDTARRACRLGVDSVLVQDWGLFSLLRQCLPDLPLHASTQMSVFTSGGACQMAADGCERVVVARECSKEDVAAICKACPSEIEVFVHGALCMCYSGQCAMSALIGGRSGNRGRCAQPCRLPYSVNGKKGSPLSLKDNCLAQELNVMSDMGISCLKLEGRMKRPEYVAVVTRIYARLLREKRPPSPAELSELEQVFSRSGFTDQYWNGTHGKTMIGTRPENPKEPKALFAQAKATYENNPLRTIPLNLDCVIHAGEPCRLTASDGLRTVTVTGPIPEAARTRPLSEMDVTQRLQKTGGTPYRCEHVTTDLQEGLSLPASAINALRRDVLNAMTDARTAVPCRRTRSPLPLPDMDCSQGDPVWSISVATAAQLTTALLDCHPQRVCVPLEVLADLTALPDAQTEWCAILPRVWRDRDEPLLKNRIHHAQTLGVNAVAVGNIGHLPLMKEFDMALWGDYGLNVFNSHALNYLRQKGLASACLSFELRFSQLRDIRKILPCEAIVYGRLPLMITENCLVQNQQGCHPADPFLRKQSPCQKPNILRDRTGAAFPLLPAFGHRTEIQNSRPLWLADRPDWKQLGLTYARLRFTTESPQACVDVFRAYQSGKAPAGEFTRGLYERGVE